MPFFDALHHGIPVVLQKERIIAPSADDICETIDAVGITTGYCGHPECRVRVYYRRNLYAGGWGPVSRVRLSEKLADLRRRLKLARESDWVWGHHPETGTKVKVMVR